MVAKVTVRADGEAHVGEGSLVGNLLCWAIQRKDLILGAVCFPEPHKVTFRGERALEGICTTTRENTIGGRGQRKTSYLHSRLLRP